MRAKTKQKIILPPPLDNQISFLVQFGNYYYYIAYNRKVYIFVPKWRWRYKWSCETKHDLSWTPTQNAQFCFKTNQEISFCSSLTDCVFCMLHNERFTKNQSVLLFKKIPTLSLLKVKIMTTLSTSSPITQFPLLPTNHDLPPLIIQMKCRLCLQYISLKRKEKERCSSQMTYENKN